MQHAHVDAPGSFGVASLPIGSQDVLEVFFILTFSCRTSCGGLFPAIVARAGYTGNLTEHADLQEIVFAPQGFFDDGEFFTGRHDGRFSFVLACLTIFLEILPPYIILDFLQISPVFTVFRGNPTAQEQHDTDKRYMLRRINEIFGVAKLTPLSSFFEDRCIPPRTMVANLPYLTGSADDAAS